MLLFPLIQTFLFQFIVLKLTNQDEEVEWQWLELPDGNRVVTNFEPPITGREGFPYRLLSRQSFFRLCPRQNAVTGLFV